MVYRDQAKRYIERIQQGHETPHPLRAAFTDEPVPKDNGEANEADDEKLLQRNTSRVDVQAHVDGAVVSGGGDCGTRQLKDEHTWMISFDGQTDNTTESFYTYATSNPTKEIPTNRAGNPQIRLSARQ